MILGPMFSGKTTKLLEIMDAFDKQGIKYIAVKPNIDNRYNLEMELIESKSKNDISWFGQVGFSNMVRLDGLLTNNNNKVIENKDKTIKITRK